MTGDPSQSPDPTVELEFGVPIPGRILPESEWVRTAIKRLPPPGPLDWPTLFGRQAAVILDLGCGNGRFILQSAISRPECDHVGVDLLPIVIRYATRRANQRGLANVRFAVRDAESFVRDYLAPGSVAEIHIYHPQPVHDRRDWRRRLVTPRFLADVHRALRPQGLFVIQTDEPAYGRYIEQVVPSFFTYQPRNDPWPDAPEGRSRREILARQKRLPIFSATGVRRDDLAIAEIDSLVARLPLPRFSSSRAAFLLDQLEREPG